MRTALRTCGVLAAATCSVSLLSAPASAAPAGESFPLVCDDGHTYDVVTARGNGAFTPAFAAGRRGALIPVSFGEFVITVEGESNDDVVFPFDLPADPAVDKGAVAARTPRDLVTCTYSFSFTVEDEPMLAEDFPGATGAHGEGTVTGFFAPARR